MSKDNLPKTSTGGGPYYEQVDLTHPNSHVVREAGGAHGKRSELVEQEMRIPSEIATKVQLVDHPGKPSQGQLADAKIREDIDKKTQKAVEAREAGKPEPASTPSPSTTGMVDKEQGAGDGTGRVRANVEVDSPAQLTKAVEGKSGKK